MSGSYPWVLWPFCTAGATKGGGCIRAPSPAGWAEAKQSERNLFGLPAYMRHPPVCYLPNNSCQTNLLTQGGHSCGFAVPPPHSVLLFPAIAFCISRRNQMAPTWSQSTATSALSILRTFPWIHYSYRSFSCKVKWKPQHAPYLPNKIRAFMAQHSDTLPSLHRKSRNYHQAAYMWQQRGFGRNICQRAIFIYWNLIPMSKSWDGLRCWVESVGLTV